MERFNEEMLPELDRRRVEAHTHEIKLRVRRTTEDLIEIGKHLIEVKAILGHGQFGAWLKSEFDWSDDTAQRLMNVAKHFGQIPHGADFGDKSSSIPMQSGVLYELARANTPESARTEALERASRGEQLSVSDARSILTGIISSLVAARMRS